VANSHVSYLQTLPKDEAIAFAASLQKVKEHLSHELHWMNEQVQQKTVQLQGIDTLLSEAAGLGLASPQTTSTKGLTASASKVSDSSVTEAVLSSVSQAAASLPEQATLAVANGNNLAASAVASPPAASAPPKRGKQRQPNKPSKTKRDVKPPVGKSTPPTAKKSEQTKPSNSDANKASLSGFQKFLQTSFQDQSMTDAVGEILASAKEPLNTDAIMAELYHGLSNDAYQRAKSSLSNILSVGKTKGKWKSPTRGMYIGNAVAAKAK
jgi:hypothetical protein